MFCNKCNCSYFGIYETKSKDDCDNDDKLKCIIKEFVKLKDNKEQFDFPLECYSVLYRISLQQFGITDGVIYIDAGEM